MDRRLWGLELNERDHLVVGGCDVVSLAELYGTPLHVVDEQRVRRNYHRFLNAFTRWYPDTRVFYSYKTNCVPGVLKFVHGEGSGAEVTSPFESWLASRLDVPPHQVIYNGVNKAPEELRRVLQAGVGLINVDSLAELDQLRRASADLQVRVDVGVRISPRLGWNAQFGLQPDGDRIVDLFREFHDARSVNLCGLHAHIGTGLRHPRTYRRLVEAVCVLMRELKRRLDLDIRYVDLGGGFGIPTVRTLSTPERALYLLLNVPPRAPRPAENASIEVFGRVIAATLNRQCARWGLREPRLLLEPGRAITSDAQVLLLQVKTIKRRRNGTTFALTDGGMQNIAFPLSYEYHH
jgi:diaminopimelate decarboxylase